MQAAGLNWEPKEDKVIGATCGVVMPRKKMLYRSDNNTPLGVVGEDYQPTKPREFLQSQYELAGAMGGQVVRAGWTERRSKVFACIRMEQNLTFPKNVRSKGDPVGVYIYSTDGWDGSTPRLSSLYLERLACTNGMLTQELSSKLWIPHTSNLEERYSVAWKAFEKEISRHLSDVRSQFVELAKARMSLDEARQFVGKLVEGEGKAAEARRAQILDLFQNGIGVEGKSKWDALNAVTEYVTHHAVYRETKIASAETSRFLGVVGGRNVMNERALRLLLE